MHRDNNANGASADRQYAERLSELLDGECSETARVLDDAVHYSDCRAKWQSYHLIRDVMQRECHSALPANFASLVGERISAEERYSESPTTVVPFEAERGRTHRAGVRRDGGARAGAAAPKWLPFAGLGLAASVAAAGVIAWQVAQNFEAPSALEASTVVAQLDSPSLPNLANGTSDDQSIESGLVRTVYRGDTGTRWLPVSGERDSLVEQRLNSLLLNHLEASSMSQVQGMVAHTRLVGYDTETANDSF